MITAMNMEFTLTLVLMDGGGVDSIHVKTIEKVFLLLFFAW